MVSSILFFLLPFPSTLKDWFNLDDNIKNVEVTVVYSSSTKQCIKYF